MTKVYSVGANFTKLWEGQSHQSVIDKNIPRINYLHIRGSKAEERHFREKMKRHDRSTLLLNMHRMHTVVLQY